MIRGTILLLLLFSTWVRAEGLTHHKDWNAGIEDNQAVIYTVNTQGWMFSINCYSTANECVLVYSSGAICHPDNYVGKMVIRALHDLEFDATCAGKKDTTYVYMASLTGVPPDKVQSLSDGLVRATTFSAAVTGSGRYQDFSAMGFGHAVASLSNWLAR